MKKLLLFSLLFFVMHVAKAQQITLTQSDFPSAGYNYAIYEVRDTGGSIWLTDSVNVGTGGASDTMDISKITNFYYSDTNNIKILTPASTGWNAFHPTANLAAYVELETDTATGDTVMMLYEFYNSTANDLILVGLTAIIDTAAMFSGTPSGNLDTAHANYSPTDTMVATAYSLGYTDTDSSFFSAVIGFFEHKESIVKDINVDGWGVLSTPNGNFNVLRVKVTERDTSTDLILGIPTNSNANTDYYYEYWAKGIGLPVAEVYMDSTWTNTWEVSYINVWPVAIIENNFDVNATLYPNPTANQVSISINTATAQNVDIIVYNAIGQKVFAKEVVIKNYYTELLDLSNLNSGLYHLVLQNKENENLFVKKLLINK